MKKILVTGSEGFVGQHLMAKYSGLAGVEVVGLDIKGNPSFKRDLSEITVERLTDILVAQEIDTVSHHAAQVDVRISTSLPTYDAQNNIIATLKLLEACVQAKVKRFIFASSGGAIGETEFPESPYGISKLTIEKYLSFFQKHHNLEVITLRYSNIYGPGQKSGVVSNFIETALGRGLFRTMSVWGGAQVRDFVYIDDVIKANVLALTCTPGTYTISTGVGTSIREVAEELLQRCGCAITYLPEKKGEVLHSVLTPNGPEGWAPTVSFQEGLTKTIESYS